MKMLTRLVSFCGIFFLPFYTSAQTYTISGRVTDDKDASALIGVSVILTQKADTTIKTGTATDADGNFTLAGQAPGQYSLRLNYVGYISGNRSVTVADKDVAIGTVNMKSQAKELKGVTVTEKQIRAEQKGDTSQFNAGAYKTNPDATAEDLVSKMPGVTSDNTGVKVNGETVQQVLVDGKPFFGNDAALALKNMPAEIIDKIQVFDRLSDQSSFTGFDDGNAQKTMNIITKRGKNEGVFGKVYAGYGTDERYLAGGNLNIFNGEQRISLMGLSNNINQQNFSSEDLLGVSGNTSGRNRGGGGRGGFGGSSANNFMVGQQGGIATTNSFGVNYSDNWGKKIKISGSYFFNSTYTVNTTDLTRNYFTDADSSNVYQESYSSDAKNLNHRVNLRLEYTIDSSNSIIFTPGISFQQNSTNSATTATNNIAEMLSSTTVNNNTADNTGYNSSSNLLFRHKFKKPRRTVSLNLAASVNAKSGDGTYSATNQFYEPASSTSFDQRFTVANQSATVSANANYTEPVGKNGQLNFSYNPSYTKSDADKETLNFNSTAQEYTDFDTSLSNKYANTYITQKGGLSYRIGDKKLNFNIGANVQYATLDGEQEFPNNFRLQRNFTNVLPNAFFNYKYADGRNLRIMYRTNTHAPSISQLQNVVDITNPLLLKTGNANLKQDFEQTFVVRYGLTNAKKANSFFLNLYAGYISDYIGNATLTGPRVFTDPFTNVSIPVNRGSQLTRPVNLDGYWNARSFLTYGLPVQAIKSNLNLNGGFNYTRIPGQIDSLLNFSNYYTPSFGVVLSSNISEQLDFTLSYSGNYNIVKNTVQAQANNNYYNHTASFRINYMFLKHFVLNTSIADNYFTSFSSTGDQNYFLWNAYLGYKFLKNNALEARVSVYDLLNQNKSISRTVTETYIENSVTQVLTQYFMFQLTYTIRSFKGGMTIPEKEEGEKRPPREHGRGGQ